MQQFRIYCVTVLLEAGLHPDPLGKLKCSPRPLVAAKEESRRKGQEGKWEGARKEEWKRGEGKVKYERRCASTNSGR